MKRTSQVNREKTVTARQKKKNVKLFVALILFGVIGIALVVYYVTSVTSMIAKEDLYQYFLDSPVTFKKGTTFSSEYMKSIGNDKQEVAKTPFYSYTNKKIYLPRNYAWQTVGDNLKCYRIPEFSSIETEGNNIYKCLVNNKEYMISEGFIFDDSEDYVFFDKGSITLDDKVIDISPLSFYSGENGVIRIYDYEKDSLYLIEEKQATCRYTSNSGYSIMLNKGLYQNNKNEQFLLISSPEAVSSIERKVK